MASVEATTRQRSSRSSAQSERRARILDATIELAGEGGFEAVQMREVAERADVALGTLYRYFPSKVDLLVAGLEREFEAAERRTATRPVPGATPEERVMFLLGRMTSALQRQPRLAEALVRAFMFADASSASDDIDAVGAHLSTVICRAIAGDPQRDAATGEETTIIRIIGDVWLAALVRWATGRATESDVERSVGDAVRLLLPGEGGDGRSGLAGDR